MENQLLGGMKRMKNKLGGVVVFGLVMVLGLSLLAACAAPAEEVAPSPATPSSVAPAPTTPSPAVPSPVASSPVVPPAVTAPPATTFPMEITDQLGRVVKLKKEPQRIISIAPSDTEILFALGLGDRVVGLDQYSDYPAEAKTKTNLGSYTSPSIEKIVALNPDLILATSVHQAKVLPVLESLGYTVVALDPKTVDQVLDSITLVGKITGKQSEATELVTKLGNRIKAVTDQTKNLSEAKRPRVFYIVWYNPLMAPGRGTFQDDLIGKAGGTNIALNLTGFATISLEAVITANPDVMIAGIIMGTDMEDKNLQFIKTEPRLKDTAARQSNRIYVLDGNVVSRPGPRIVDALEEFAKFIHPELFK